eukprot:5558843-Pyramimonas_sp.AAC.1
MHTTDLILLRFYGSSWASNGKACAHNTPRARTTDLLTRLSTLAVIFSLQLAFNSDSVGVFPGGHACRAC